MALKIAVLMILHIAVYTCLTEARSVQNNKDWETCNEKRKHDNKINCCTLENGDVEDYDTDNYLCCNRTMKRHAHNQKCCEKGDVSIFYDEKEVSCCGGDLYNIVPGNDYQCCGGEKWYNTKTHFCCVNGKRIPAEYHVFLNITSRSQCPTGYCNNKPYYGNENTCCNGVLHSSKTNHFCCGNTLYHNITEICCNGQKHKKVGHSSQCCGENYLSKGEKCCGKDNLKKGFLCCGGKVPYNPNVSLCTAGSKIEPIGTPLCGEMKYDPKTHVCCDGITPMKANKVGDDKCCKPRNRVGTTFNSNTSTCDDGKVKSIIICGPAHTKHKYTCCNNLAYEQPAYNTVCCEDKAEWYQPNNPDHVKCWKPLCNNSWFNHDTHECCNDELINRRKQRCIDQVSYDYHNKREWVLHDLRVCGSYVISQKYNCCADLMPYDIKRHNCPISEFGNEKPIKPPAFPFWPLIKCRTQKKTGKIVKVEEKHGKVTFVLKARRSRKEYTIHVSNKQKGEIFDLKDDRTLVVIYYEKSLKNELFLGEYGAIEKKQRRHRHGHKKQQNCEEINNYFLSSSS